MEKEIEALKNEIVKKIVDEDWDPREAVRIYVGRLFDSIFLELPRAKRIQLAKMADEKDDRENFNSSGNA